MKAFPRLLRQIVLCELLLVVAVPAAIAQFAGMGGDEGSDRPNFIRAANFITVVSPRGDEIASINLLTGKTSRARLCGTGDRPKLSTLVQGPGVVATLIRGTKILRIAASDDQDGTLISQDLVEPASGAVVPIVGRGIACYVVGDHAYAFSPILKRWGVVKLATGHGKHPEVGSGYATVVAPNHIYTFTPKTAKWEHVDLEKLFGPGEPAIKGEAGSRE